MQCAAADAAADPASSYCCPAVGRHATSAAAADTAQAVTAAALAQCSRHQWGSGSSSWCNNTHVVAILDHASSAATDSDHAVAAVVAEWLSSMQQVVAAAAWARMISLCHRRHRHSCYSCPAAGHRANPAIAAATT